MHAILGGLKRAWHGCLRVTRPVLAALALTAARFDLLYVLEKGGRTRRQLRQTLGVDRTTISRMVGSLDALGFVVRERFSAGFAPHTATSRRCIARGT